MRLPKVMRQVGKVTGNNRVYIEDYAYTYLNDLKAEGKNFPLRVALYGHAFQKEAQKFYLIYGASCVVEELETGRNQEQIAKAYFGDYSLIGYINLYSGGELPGQKEGCFIFYEKNEAMQNYLVSCYERKLRGHEDDRRNLICQKEKVSEKILLKERTGSLCLRCFLQKLLLFLMVIIAALSALTISSYQQMSEFTEMAARAVQIMK